MSSCSSSVRAPCPAPARALSSALPGGLWEGCHGVPRRHAPLCPPSLCPEVPPRPQHLPPGPQAAEHPPERPREPPAEAGRSGQSPGRGWGWQFPVPPPHELCLPLCPADFGFAQYMSPWDEKHVLRGSPLYMAPEMVCRQQYDARVDLWSVGVILYGGLSLLSPPGPGWGPVSPSPSPPAALFAPRRGPFREAPLCLPLLRRAGGEDPQRPGCGGDAGRDGAPGMELGGW